MAEGDKKFGHVDRADDEAGLMAFREECGGDHGAPTTSANGVEETAGEREGDGFGGFGGNGDRFVVCAVKNVSTHQDEVGTDPRFKFFAREVGKDVGARDPSDDSGNAQLEEKGFIYVLVEDVAYAADAGGEDFRNFDAIADQGRCGAEREEERGAGYAVGHAECAVDNLACEAHEDGDEEGRRHVETLGEGWLCAEGKKGV